MQRLHFFKVDMIFGGRDAMLFPPLEKGGRGDSLCLRYAAICTQKANPPRESDAIAAWLHQALAPFYKVGMIFAGRDAVNSLFPKVDMIFSGRDAMLFPPLEKGGRGGFALPSVRGDLYPKSESPAR